MGMLSVVVFYRNIKLIILIFRDVDSTALQREVKYLDEAFKAFFDKRGGFPHYKSKKDDKKSYTSVNNGNTIRFNGDEIRLPKVGWVKAKN